MCSSAGGEALAAFAALEAALDRVTALRFDLFGTAERFGFLERIESVRRQLPVAEHVLINGIVEHATPAEIGGVLGQVLADRLRVTRAEAARRIGEAEVLGPRTGLTGERMGPLWAATAAGQRAGDIGAAQVREIRRFFKQLPGWVDEPTRELAERDLVTLGAGYRPDELRVAAAAMADAINPDGNFCDEQRARRRGIRLGSQGVDGMSPISGYLTPEARAGLDAVLGKWAAPGMCNPDDQSPTVDGSASPQAAQGDFRGRAQRNHDALAAACRAVLASGQLGAHHGLPVSLVVQTTLGDLQSGAGKATTGGGTWLAMSEVIRLAAYAHHYLAVFDDHTGLPLYLGRSKRCASAGQRIVLHAKDRGCTHPGCTVPGYLCEVHHVEAWATGGRTDIDNLTFACGAHHKLLDNGWRTRKLFDGTTEWLPPPHQNHGQPTTNNYHHPQRYLTNTDEDSH
jgi:hypothetical protein